MIKIEMEKTEFTDIIEKMALPIKSPEKRFLFTTIALTILPEDKIEWIGESQDVTVWTRVRCTTSTDIYEPVQIPIDVQEFYSNLKAFKIGKIISFIYDPDQGSGYLVDENEENSRKLRMNAPTKSAVKGLLERLPYRLEQNTEMILFKNGLVKPNISGSCDVKIFQDLIEISIKNKNSELSDIKQKSLKKKMRNKPSIYNIYIDGENRQIKTVNKHGKYKIEDVLSNANVNGSGELHYSSGFAEVVKVLSGEIKFYAVDNGPLWIMQDTNRMKLRYLIAPYPVYTY